jgi:hypothetical protein
MKPKKRNATRRWRVRVLPGFTVDYVGSERTARKKLAFYASKVHADVTLGRNMLMIKSVVIEYDEGDGWVIAENKTTDELVALHEESLT